MVVLILVDLFNIFDISSCTDLLDSIRGIVIAAAYLFKIGSLIYSLASDTFFLFFIMESLCRLKLKM